MSRTGQPRLRSARAGMALGILLAFCSCDEYAPPGECVRDQDCPPGHICSSDHGCMSNPGNLMEPPSLMPVEPECTEDEDCGENSICLENKCVAGERCADGLLKSAEKCDGRDNNCDGSTDEDYDVAGECAIGLGECRRTGSFACAPGGTRVVCILPEANSPTVELCDGKDNDCDGATDEDQPDLGTSCSLGIGGCAATGKFICALSTEHVLCDASPTAPKAELCGDGIDNDCDGLTDESCEELGQTCSVGLGACQRQGTLVPTPNMKGLVCVGSDDKKVVPGPPEQEVCDGKDNDCDGAVDMTLGAEPEVLLQECSSPCGMGTEICLNGQWANCSARQPSAEVCDHEDNDCNGWADDAPECDLKWKVLE